MRLFLIIILTAFAVFNILRDFGLFEINTRINKVSTSISDERKKRGARKRASAWLGICSSLTNLFRGILMSEITYRKHKYYIERLDIRSNALGRQLTPEELRGQHALPLALSVLTIPLILFYPIFIVIPVVAFFYFASYTIKYEQQIADEDEIIDNYFIDLYLLMFSKFRQGSRARLQGTVENYIDTVESQAKTRESEVMLKLARYLLNLLAIYEDHVAIPHLKDIYHSATIINFCNVASQSLQGIDNYDNLLTFKMQLVERKTVLMRKRQQAILRRGQMSIYAIWVILFIFIVVGWYSKLPTGMF